MAQHDRIDLAHEVDFAIGPLSIRPSTREITRGDHREIIEPRVMQVLVALARAQGAVLSKDDLIETCWESRVVGEDAVNRVLSRLRKVSEGIGKGAFHVETVTRVGYRLIAEGMPAPPEPAPGHALPDRAVLLDRRWALGMLAAAALATGSGWLTLKRKPAPPAGLSNLLDKAEAALAYNTPEQNDAAVGIMQEAARRFPERAEAWGKLAIAYRQQGLNSRRSDALDIMGRAQAAARRAVEIDGDNADGAVVIAVGNGLWFSSYANYDGATARVLAQFADHSLARRTRASFLFETGRVRESVEVGAALVDPHLPLPGSTSQAIRLWAAGRPDEAEALLDTLIGRWPRHYSVWSTRYKFLLFSGKAKKAENMLGDSPVGLEDIDFAIWASQTKAILSGSPDDVTAALRLFDGIAASVMSKAQEAVIFASAVGRVDAAFDYLDLYYFTALGVRSFRKRFPPRQLQPHSGVLTYFLFEPPMRAVREDARFASLVERLGLSSYWRTNRLKPDFAERA